MKTSLFAALLCAFVAQTTSAQTALPYGLQSHASNWPKSVVKSLQRLGYQMPSDAAVPDRSSELVLDSTITFYGYDGPFPTDSIPLYKTIFQSESPNTRTEENEQFEAGAWLKLDRATITSDGLGRDVYAFAETFDPVSQTYLPNSYLEAYPHGNTGMLYDSIFTYEWNAVTSGWDRLLAIFNTYGVNDQLAYSISNLNLFGTQVWIKDVYTYDANGDNTLIESFLLLDGFEYPGSIVANQYVNHLPVETITSSVDENGQVIPESRVTRTFVLSDKEKQVDTYERDSTNTEWVRTERITNAYDAQSRLITKEQTTFFPDGMIERLRMTYNYKEGEHLAQESVYFWTGAQFLLSDRKYYYYSGGTTAVHEKQSNLPLTLSPNPTVGQVQLQLDEPAEVKIFNTHGELLSSGTYQSNAILWLSDLPNGLYFVTARTETDLYTGRMVKQ